MWLFPHDGEPVYTYERARIEVTADGLDYRQPRLDGRTARLNALEGIDCQYRHLDGRDCAFDRHLLADGPVTVPIDKTELPRGERAADYTEIDGRYYERIRNRTDDTVRYDVWAVDPQSMLATLALDYRDADSEVVREHAEDRVETRVVVQGESVTTRERPPESALGSIHRLPDGYSAVVLAGETRPDRPWLDDGTRAVAGAAGVACLLVALGVTRSRRRGRHG